MTDDTTASETTLSSKSTSNWIYARSHIASAIMIGAILYLLFKYPEQMKQDWQRLALLGLILFRIVATLFLVLKAKSEKTTLTNQRLRLKSGILSVESSDIELYRVKDILLRQNPIQRMLGLGDVRIMTTDKLNPELYLRCLPAAAEFRELLRNQVELVRDKKRVREVDMNLESADASPEQV